MKQTFYNEPKDCKWLKETHLQPANLVNRNPIPEFKSFCLFGNENPESILLYREQHPCVDDKPKLAMLLAGGKYAFVAC